MGEDFLGSGYGLDQEALPSPTSPQLSRGEPADRHTRLLQQVQQAPCHGGLADPGAALQ